MTKRLRPSFGLDAGEKDAPRCPGEAACGKFKIASSETGNGSDACVNCELLPTKPAAGKAAADGGEDYDAFLGMVFDTRARMRLGELDKSLITNLHYESAIIAEQLIESFEREAAARARVAQEENSKLITAMLKGLANIR